MRLVFALVGVAALSFIVGGVGTIVAFVTHADPTLRAAFMWICLAGLVPTVALCAVAVGVGLFDVYRYRIRGDRPPSETVS